MNSSNTGQHTEDLSQRWRRYKCSKCGYVYEGVKILKKCPRCGSEELEESD